MTGKIILLNGPPSSGKDTAAKHIRDLSRRDTIEANNPFRDGLGIPYPGMRVVLDRMSMPIKRAFAGTVGLPITEDGIVEPWESNKELPIPSFGVSYRQWQIGFSESFLKCYDISIFGRLAAARIHRLFHQNLANLVVIPDCGFDIEIEVLYEEFPREDILLIRCHRNGFTFSGDSRSYVRAPAGCAIFDPLNEDRDKYLEQVEAGVRCWLETPERMPREE